MEKLELRLHEANFQSVSEGLKVSGYVNKTNQWSQELGIRKKFVERILPGTFEKAINRGNEINFLAEHDNGKILSSTRNNSLSLREDEHGLFMEATISPTSWGKDYHTLIKDGIIRNMSFGMKVVHDTWKKLPNGTYERSIDDLVLAEVSAVRNPAYVQSTIQARSIEIVEDVEIPAELDEVQDEIREEEPQMELEIRDKLAEVLDKILVTLENQNKQPEKAPEPVKNVEPVVEKAPEIVPEPQAAQPVVAEKPVEQVEKVVETTQPAVKAEQSQPVAVEEKPVLEEKPAEKSADLTQYYKKMLDF